MSVFLQLLKDPTWDSPFFKRLAKNDSGQAKGHQGGVAIPRELHQYFPVLDEGQASAESPTASAFLRMELYDGIAIGTTFARYHFQTWRGKRVPELRLTRLADLHSRSKEGDLLIFQRKGNMMDCYRVFLVSKTCSDFTSVNQLTNGQDWGILFAKRIPVIKDDLVNERSLMDQESLQPFKISQPVRRGAQSEKTRIIRDTVFRSILLQQYGRRCAISGIALSTPGTSEVQAAHVVALNQGGADEPRNGFTLTSTLHWAFDNGLFGIGDDRRVIIPDVVLDINENKWLEKFKDKPMAEASDSAFKTAHEAFAWHREHVLATPSRWM